LTLVGKTFSLTPSPTTQFCLNSMINSVRTPDMLHLFGYTATADCPLCKAPKCTLHHILVGCKVALDQGRYSWRHDSVLWHVETALTVLLRRFQNTPVSRTSLLRKSFSSSFVRSGKRSLSGTRAPPRSILDGSNDWSLVVDYKHNPVVFPPNIVATTERPDVVS